DRAAAEAKRSIDLAHNLSRADRLFVEASAHEAIEEWKDASEAYGALFKFYPDDIEYGLSLANSQRRQGRPKDALATAAGVHRLGDDPRIGISEATAALDAGDPKHGRQAAEAAIAESQRRQLPAAEGKARLRLAKALAETGQLEPAKREVEIAQKIF